MSIQQAHQRLGIAEGNIHELQEQLQRVSAGHHATHQLLSILRSKVDTRSRVRLVETKKDLDARPVREEERPDLDNLVVFGEGLRRRGEDHPRRRVPIP